MSLPPVKLPYKDMTPDVTTKIELYELTIKKVVVTYYDDVKKTFTPAYWAIYEKQVTPIAKHIKILKRRASIWSLIKRFFKSLFKK